MKASNKTKVPTLDDVVIPGKEVSEINESSPVLSEVELTALGQQIEKLVQARLQSVFDKAMQQAMTEIKTHLDKKLPELIASIKK
ncbi:MAG: hypothetical protein BWK79_02405 [Beggiatoa sp. IS2]|nr:MAG: hypothetical protein BWK79_02405 [Beggiatoa sp. IS2]